VTRPLLALTLISFSVISIVGLTGCEVSVQPLGLTALIPEVAPAANEVKTAVTKAEGGWYDASRPNPLNVALADSLLKLKLDPFLIKIALPPEALPEVEGNDPTLPDGSPNPDASAEAPPEVPTSPLEQVTLSGISYSSQKKPMALLASPSGTHLTEKGSFIQWEDKRLKVLAITANGITLAEVDANGKVLDQRQLDLADVVGYAPKAASGASGEGQPAAGNAEGGAVANPQAALTDALKQLSRTPHGSTNLSALNRLEEP
jgi:hypothetical protein